MTLNDEIKAHAKRVAKDIKAGKASKHAHLARDFLEDVPDAILGVVDLVHREANRKKPNENLVQAYLYMFFNGLEVIRYEVDRGHEWAEDLVDGVRDLLELLAEGGVIAPDLLMLLLNGFIEAKLEPGDDLTKLLGDIASETMENQPPPNPEEFDDLFKTMVEEVGGNEFDVHSAIADISQTLPPEFRTAVVYQIAKSDNPVLRDVAVLYLLDATPEVRRTVCRIIADQASPAFISPVAFRRMIAIRNWLPETERHHLDAAIKTVRRKQVDCATWPQKKVEQIIASQMDGAGAQSVFAVVKEGRKFLIASLLVKQGVGVADAWCIRNQSKAEVKDFLKQIHAETDSHQIEPDYLHLLVPHFLAVGHNAGNVPIPGLLDFVEAVGIDSWQPAELSVDELLSILEHDTNSSNTDQTAVAHIIEGSGDWLRMYEFVNSWFEEDAEVNDIFSQNIKSKTPAKINVIIKSILEPRRDKWTERFLWTALWLKQKNDLVTPWFDFFVIGRELHQGRPIKDIPIMRTIAETTVMVEREARISRF